MFKAMLGVYLIIGILSLFYRTDCLHKDLETQGPFVKVRIYQVLIALMAILAWPFRLADLREKKPKGIQILLEVSVAFQEVAQERGEEEIDRHTMGFIISKFILMNKQFGSKFCREHLKYELEKYKKEGLRGDYVEGGASLKIAQ